ncbi:hypothetical protein JVU11DRAFT_9940 [Chiua virens]|nr:hypothetical protein JVU11DRAFT_9940 [Chiua virens]
MQFPFTFTLNVPGLHNPFLAKPGPALAQSRIEGPSISRQISSLPPPRFPPANSFPPPPPLARKRGWIPSEPEPSQAATSAASTAGYLDTPAKYRDMPLRGPEEEVEEMIAELPPAKRRRTLAGSIVSYSAERCSNRHRRRPHCISTVLNNALAGEIGVNNPTRSLHLPLINAVIGFPTVQNLDRLCASVQGTQAPSGRTIRPALRRASPSQVSFKIADRHSSSQRITHSVPLLDRNLTTSMCTTVRMTVAQDVEPESNQMDWIGDRLTRLIQEGQKALGREVVVMSEAKEDEVDDGSDAWEEEANNRPGQSVSRRGSVRSLRRAHRPRDIPLPPSYSLPSPRKRNFETDSVHLSPGRSHGGHVVSATPRRHARGVSVESDVFAPVASSLKEDESAWQSPELRESMERARARYLQRRVSMSPSFVSRRVFRAA